MKTKLFKRCPKSNKIVGINVKSNWFKLLFPIIGLFALVWFLIRVIPKPSRASYPCQQVAAPIAAGFLSFLASITGITFIYRIIKSKKSARAIATGAASAIALCVTVFLIVPASFTGCGNTAETPPVAATIAPSGPSEEGAEKPTEWTYENITEYYQIAQGVGINPGRVVFTRNENGSNFDAEGKDGSWRNDNPWWSDENTNPDEVKKMFDESLCKLTGEDTVEAAWSALFKNFNGGADYKKGEKFVIKPNFNSDGWNADNDGYNDCLTPSPQLLEAIASSLINVVGADASDITITDPSRSNSGPGTPGMGQKFFDRFEENEDEALRNVNLANDPEPDYDAPINFADGAVGYVAKEYSEAKYLINVALFSPHNAFGFTFCGKNNYGSVWFDYDVMDPKGEAPDYYRLDIGGCFAPIPMHGGWLNGYGGYSYIAELTASKELGGKTLLYMVDAMYTRYHQGDPSTDQRGKSIPNTRKMVTFGDDYPQALFMSQDPVAIDSVAADFLRAEQKVNDLFCPEKLENYDPTMVAITIPDNYLVEASFADNPPSNTKYDPDGTGNVKSLGAYERWNNDNDKQYSRNLGLNYGIELVTVTQ